MTPPSAIVWLSSLAKRLRITDGQLDELVQALKSEEAAQINNGGVLAQLVYLLKASGDPAQVRLWLEERARTRNAA